MTTTEPADDAGGAPARRRRRPSVAVIAAVLFAAVAVLLAVVATSLQRELDAERRDRRAVERVAGAFSEAILTFDDEDVEATRERVLGLSTGAFAEEFEAAFGDLASLVQAAASQARATVKDVFVGEVAGDEATAVTVVDLTAEGAAGPRTVADTYLRLSLVRVEGEWRVDGVTSLNFAQPAPGGDGPADR